MFLDWDSTINDNDNLKVDHDLSIKEKIAYMKDHPEIYLQRDKKGKGWICPICGSGSGQHGTGMTEGKGKYKGLFTCWNCRKTSDVIGIIQLVEGISNRKDAFKRALEIYNIK